MEVKIKKLMENVVIPTYAKPGDAGMDLTATDLVIGRYGEFVYHTGIAMEIPEGYVGLIFPRSSNRETEAYMTNHVGVIDSGYRGEILVTFKNRDIDNIIPPYEPGNKIAQIIIMPYPQIEFTIVDKLSKTERGEGGHGSTGK